MSKILELQEKMKDTSAALQIAERAAAQTPMSQGVLINQRSLRKRFAELEEEFRKATESMAIDVCRYRMFKENDTPNALASTRAIADFQQLVSLVYDSLIGSVKQRARVSAEAVRDTSFGIGYVFPGSIGFVLTLPSERNLFNDGTSAVDLAIHTVFAVAKSQSETSVATVSKTLGPSVVRSIYKWAKLHLDYWMGLDIEWMRGSAIKSELFLQPKELANLCHVIEKTSERIDEDDIVEGTYVGGDVVKQTIHIEVPDAADIYASWGDEFSEDQLPNGYWVPVRAHFIKRTIIHLATDQEEVKYLITYLEELSS